MSSWQEFSVNSGIHLGVSEVLRDLAVNAFALTTFPLEAVLLVSCFRIMGSITHEFMTPALECVSIRSGVWAEILLSIPVSISLSMPEIALSIVGLFASDTSTSHSLPIEAMLGGGWVSFLLIPGLSCWKGPLHLEWVPMARDTISYSIMCLVILRAVGNGGISPMDSLLVMVQCVLYLMSMVLTQAMSRNARLRAREQYLMMALKPIQEVVEQGEILGRLPMDLALSRGTTAVYQPLETCDSPPFVEDPRPARQSYSLSTSGRMVSYFCVRALPGTSSERLYFLTVVNAFVIYMGLSYIVCNVGIRWTSVISPGFPSHIVGPIVLGLLSQLGELVRSATATTDQARAHVVSTALSSQVYSVGLGLGLPWMVRGFWSEHKLEVNQALIEKCVIISLIAVGVFSVYCLIHAGKDMELKSGKWLIFGYVFLCFIFSLT